MSNPPPPEPGDKASLCYLSAVDAIALFRARRLSPVELLEAIVERAEAVEPTVNAFSHRFFDEAFAQARKAEARYARPGARTRKLEGLPVAIKDEVDVKGQPNTSGSLVYRDARPAHTTSISVERVLRAGAVVHARTTTPEFSSATFTHSRLWGVTRNPWNPGLTPGGSSGGSGAALAAGTTTLATGSDIGGSIRVPASCCGVVGFKPPYGRNPEESPLNLDYYCHTGPLARSVADCALLQNVMSGPHPHDIATVRPKLRIPAAPGGIEGWRIAFSPDLGYVRVDPEVDAIVRGALEGFRERGATVEEIELGWSGEVLDAALAHLVHLFGAWIARLLPTHAEALTSYARGFAESAAESTPERLLSAMETAGKMYDTLGPLLRKYRLLVCPTLAIPAVEADLDPVAGEVRVNRAKVEPILGWCLTYPFNMLSRCPVMSVPAGRAANGVPVGLQIVGRTFDDVSVFRAAAALERARPWRDWRPAP